jgi:2-dehydro-3-deoxygluconokinase
MITTFGEIMLRISPKDMGERIMQATDFEIRPGGSESNVAIALANLGVKTALIFVSIS